MREFMLSIHNEAAGKAHLDETTHLTFVRSCESYIKNLQMGKKLIAAQPMIKGGQLLKKIGNQWELMDISKNQHPQVGYYHIRAKDMEEAIGIAKANPEFEFVPSASVEIREIKTKEESTGFEYPKQ